MKEKEQVLDKAIMFEEMRDSMQQSVDNISMIIEQQKDLIKLVEENNKENKYDDFIKEMKEGIENLENQKNTLSLRISKANKLLLVIKNDEKVKEYFLNMCDVFGIFNR